MAYTYDAHKEKLAAQWAAMKILRQRAEMERVAKKLLEKKITYQAAELATGVPWWMIAVIDLREGGEAKLGRTHLHCGDPLSGYTVHVPAGRPQVGHGPPFAWLESAIDALRMKQFHTVKDWPIERVLHELEPYNGLGYHNKGIPSPYIWSCTNQYDPPHGPGGKYVSDGVFDAHAVDQQVGCAPQIAVLAAMDASITLRSYKAAPTATPPSSPPAKPPVKPPAVPAGPAVVVGAGGLAAWFANHFGFGSGVITGIVIVALLVAVAVWIALHKTEKK